MVDEEHSSDTVGERSFVSAELFRGCRLAAAIHLGHRPDRPRLDPLLEILQSVANPPADVDEPGAAARQRQPSREPAL